MDFLPVTPADCKARGWDRPDFIMVSGDAYVDHPSFGHAVIARVLESRGYRVAVLAQPGWRSCDDFKRFGRPRLAFLVCAGNIDSMVNHYTAARKPRSEDAYSPGGRRGMRPDRALIVYCNRIREAYKNIPICIGGLEASLRRFAHYDYWDDKVRRSVLVDSGADLLVYGMGERAIAEWADALNSGRRGVTDIAGTCYISPAECFESTESAVNQTEAYIADNDVAKPPIILPSYEEVLVDKRQYAHAFLSQYREQDSITGRVMAQSHGTDAHKCYLVQNPPAKPLNQNELDAVFALPFARDYHPDYSEGVPAISEVKFSIAATRGCFGGCNFCALTFHQGRSVQARSHESVISEAKLLTGFPDFKGYINDVGGPTANFRRPACDKQLTAGVCAHRQCMAPNPCKNLKVDHSEYIGLLRKLRALPKVKKVFIRSGIRFDYMMLDRSGEFIRELIAHHVSGQLKVAPEHVNDEVLSMMGKPGCEIYKRFAQKFTAITAGMGKEQYLVPYFMSSHPGSDLNAAIALAEFLRDSGCQPEQVQDFYPTPGTLSTCMFYTGLNPLTMKPVYVPKDPREKTMQRALMQPRRPQNHALVREALRIAGRDDLIGYGKRCLVPPAKTPDNRNKKSYSRRSNKR